MAVVEDMVVVVLLFAALKSLEMEQLVAIIVVVARRKRSCLKRANTEQKPTRMERQMVMREKVLIELTEQMAAYIGRTSIQQPRGHVFEISTKKDSFINYHQPWLRQCVPHY